MRAWGRLLGVLLLTGGLLVGGIIVWVVAIYYQEGQLSAAAAVLFGLLGWLLLVVPQLAFALYLWRWPGSAAEAAASRSSVEPTELT